MSDYDWTTAMRVRLETERDEARADNARLAARNRALEEALREVVNTYDAVAQGAATYHGFAPLERLIRAALAAKEDK